MLEEQTNNVYLRELTKEKYKYGFTTDIHTDIIETYEEIEVKQTL